MFKYTPPWQVLCNSMEHEIKLQKQSAASTSHHRYKLPMTQEDQAASRSIQDPARQAPESPQERPSSTGGMETAPRRWVIQPLSPKLEQTDLRSILASGREQSGQERRWVITNEEKQNGSLTLVFPQHSVTVTSRQSEGNRDVLVRTGQVQVSEGGKSRSCDASCPSSPSSTTSTESQNGFYSFVEEESNPEAEKTEAWMASPERQAKLATLKEENGFKLRAYSEERKPEKLFQVGNNDSRYQMEDAAEAVEQDERDQMQERLEIIRSQAPRKKPAFTKQLGALESLDLSNSSQMLEGFSLCYSPSSAEKSHTETEPRTIDTEGISFSAARQQFLNMEQIHSNPFLQSSQQLPSSKSQEKAFQADEKMVTSRKGTCGSPPGGQLSPSFDLDSVQNGLSGSGRVTVYTSEEKTCMNQSCLPDNFNSELQYLRSNDSDKVLGQEETGSGSSSLGMTETPIEREIRLAQEREESLRRERGIKRTDTKEMVEIKTKPLFSVAGPSAMLIKAKEKNRVSFFIQREIEMESQREADLQNQGKVPGLYDRGTPRELEDRKRVFEQQRDPVPVRPNKTSVVVKQADVIQAKTRAGDSIGTSQTAALEEKEKSSEAEEKEEEEEEKEEEEVILPPCCPHRHPDEKKALQPFNTGTLLEALSMKERNPHTPQALSYLTSEEDIMATDGTRNRETPSQTPTVARTESTNAVNSGDAPSRSAASKGSTLARGNYSARFTPFLYTPPSTPTGSPTLSSRAILHQTGQEKFSLRPRRVHTPEAIRREIEQDLKREEELRMLRETSALFASRDIQDRANHQALSPGDVAHETLQAVFGSETPNVPVLKEEAAEIEEQVLSVPHEKRTSERVSDLSFSLESDTVDHQRRTPATSRLPEKVTESSSPVPSPRLVPRLPSVSIVTAQPWSSPRLCSPTLTQFAAPKPQSMRSETGIARAQKGLTETLLDDFEERRVRMKMGENAYAGIQPTDDVNNEVLEATRVVRHKNTRALRWEAGVFANKGED